MRLELPPRGTLRPNSEVDPLRFYYVPVVGRVFAARLDAGLALLDGMGAVERVLEVGFGSGLLLPTLARRAGRVDGIDLSSEPGAVRADLARLGVQVGELVRGDARAMPFADGAYDLVVAFSILEHLRPEEQDAPLAEMARVLRPGGRLLVGCPAVHKAMNLAFAAIGFRGIEQHHFSSIHDVLGAARRYFVVEKQATWPRGIRLGWAPYGAVLLRKLA